MTALRQKKVEHLHGTGLVASYRWIPRPAIARQLGYAFHSVCFQRALPARPRLALLPPPPVIAVVPPRHPRSPRGLPAGPAPRGGRPGRDAAAWGSICRRLPGTAGAGPRLTGSGPNAGEPDPPETQPRGARGAPPGAPRAVALGAAPWGCPRPCGLAREAPSAPGRLGGSVLNL